MQSKIHLPIVIILEKAFDDMLIIFKPNKETLAAIWYNKGLTEEQFYKQNIVGKDIIKTVAWKK